MKNVFLILVYTISLINFAEAQDPIWLNYTNGKSIRSLADDDNYIWTGTSGGLAELNKTSGAATFYTKVNSGLPDNEIRSLIIDKNGTTWIGTIGGLAAYNEDGIPVGINEMIKTENLFDIYPNPVKNIVHIEPTE